MSRVGATPIKVPSGVTLSQADGIVSAKGGNGELSKALPPMVELAIGEEEVTVKSISDTIKGRALWGTARALVSNMVVGVSEGFNKNLTIHGVGYRASMKGNTLVLNLGLSHSVEMEIPEGIKCKVENNTQVFLTGYDKEALGQFASEIRSKRPPEPYKGKGIHYEGEQILRKEGKKK
jgi:large subunit ribosomal protein L6